eukprot:746558-Hanusia_phi.AAC.1
MKCSQTNFKIAFLDFVEGTAISRAPMAALPTFTDELAGGAAAHETAAPPPEPSTLQILRVSDLQPGMRMSFKGHPGQEGYSRRVKLIQVMLQLPSDHLFCMKEKSNTFREITDILNKDPVFGGALKYGTTRDKWLEIITTVDAILAGGEEKFIKTASSGKSCLNELDELYLKLARIKSDWLRTREQNREGAGGEDQRGRKSVGNAAHHHSDLNLEDGVSERMDKSRASCAISDHSEEGGGSSDENGQGASRSTLHPNQSASRESNKRPRVDSDRPGRNRAAIGSANANFSAVFDWLRTSDEKYLQSLEADRAVAKIKAEAELQHEKAKVLKREAEVLAKKTESYERGIELLKLLASCHEKGIAVPPHMLV